ncbi:MAG: DUF438 domain-containing protein [Kiritimatiellae bacterium]|nr:DUF438 domain-containing protein [Kiritimatiellia bacterium]
MGRVDNPPVRADRSSMTITPDTTVHELLRHHPELLDTLTALSPRFGVLRNPVARATLARTATLRRVAELGGLPLEDLLRTLSAAIASTPRPPGASASADPREQRLQTLRAIIRSLHEGGDLERARARFAAELGDVSAQEIAELEQQLIREGLPVAEIQRLCDLHVGALRAALDRHAAVEAPPGHPIHTAAAENRRIEQIAADLAELGRFAADLTEDAFAARAHALAAEFDRIELHYRRKENQWFPLLERHGITGPSQVMWAVHDEIRSALKSLRTALERGDRAGWAADAPAAARALAEMVYKEEKILFPLALATLTPDEWAELRRGEDTLGYGWTPPAALWPSAAERPGDVSQEPPPPVSEGLPLDVGRLSLEQINLIFRHLPVEISFVDEHDEVRFYNETPHRVFPRSPAVIGRKVQNCHPPKSLPMVQEILDEFRAGRRDVAEFWMQNRQGRFLHIRYFAVRDAAGGYRGCIEVAQDVTGIRALEGERRLLQWDRGAARSPPG